MQPPIEAGTFAQTELGIIKRSLVRFKPESNERKCTLVAKRGSALVEPGRIMGILQEPRYRALSEDLSFPV
jgi:hypothetical protein